MSGAFQLKQSTYAFYWRALPPVGASCKTLLVLLLPLCTKLRPRRFLIDKSAPNKDGPAGIRLCLQITVGRGEAPIVVRIGIRTPSRTRLEGTVRLADVHKVLHCQIRVFSAPLWISGQRVRRHDCYETVHQCRDMKKAGSADHRFLPIADHIRGPAGGLFPSNISEQGPSRKNSKNQRFLKRPRKSRQSSATVDNSNAMIPWAP